MVCYLFSTNCPSYKRMWYLWAVTCSPQTVPHASVCDTCELLPVLHKLSFIQAYVIPVVYYLFSTNCPSYKCMWYLWSVSVTYSPQTVPRRRSHWARCSVPCRGTGCWQTLLHRWRLRGAAACQRRSSCHPPSPPRRLCPPPLCACPYHCALGNPPLWSRSRPLQRMPTHTPVVSTTAVKFCTSVCVCVYTVYLFVWFMP